MRDPRNPGPLPWPIELYGDDTWEAHVRFFEPGPTRGSKGSAINVTGRQYAAQVRGDDGTVLATMTVDLAEAAGGVVKLRIPDDKIRGLRGVWDLEEVIPASPGVAVQESTLFRGPVTWSSDVTR